MGIDIVKNNPPKTICTLFPDHVVMQVVLTGRCGRVEGYRNNPKQMYRILNRGNPLTDGGFYTPDFKSWARDVYMPWKRSGNLCELCPYNQENRI